jgi:hypothetical protein
MNDADMEKLEYFLDEYYLPELVVSLSRLCQLKADDARGSDKEVARKFETYTDILNDAHAKIEEVS